MISEEACMDIAVHNAKDMPPIRHLAGDDLANSVDNVDQIP